MWFKGCGATEFHKHCCQSIHWLNNFVKLFAIIKRNQMLMFWPSNSIPIYVKEIHAANDMSKNIYVCFIHNSNFNVHQ